MTKNPNELARELGLDRDEHEGLRFLGEVAFLCLYRRDWERAEALFEGLRALVPEDPVGYLGAAELAIARERPGEALSSTRAQLENARSDPGATAFAHALEGRAHELEENWERARDAYRAAVDLAPHSPAARAARDRIRRLELLSTPEGWETET